MQCQPARNDMNILLIHQYAGNKGDRAVLVALCHLLKCEFPDVRIAVSTSNPLKWKADDLQEGDNVEFCPSGWDYQDASSWRMWFCILDRLKKYTFTILRFLQLHHIRFFTSSLMNPQFHEKLNDANIVLSVGGHHFTTLLSRDLVSGINFDSMCVMAANKPLVLFSQSFGPFVFHNEHNKNITKQLLNYCKSIYCRENKSVIELQLLGVNNQGIQQTSETVLALNGVFDHRRELAARKKQIGIAIYSTQKRTPDQLEHYCNVLAGFAKKAISDGFQVLFFPMELKGSAPDDRWLISKILKLIDSSQADYIDNDLPTVEHLRRVEECSLFVGHKTHSTIFALATGTPLIGICYHPKTREFMKQFSCEEFAIDDDKLTAEALETAYRKISGRLEELSIRIFECAKLAGKQISNDLRRAVLNSLQE